MSAMPPISLCLPKATGGWKLGVYLILLPRSLKMQLHSLYTKSNYILWIFLVVLDLGSKFIVFH
jgi:hypothetical protein